MGDPGEEERSDFWRFPHPRRGKEETKGQGRGGFKGKRNRQLFQHTVWNALLELLRLSELLELSRRSEHGLLKLCQPMTHLTLLIFHELESFPLFYAHGLHLFNLLGSSCCRSGLLISLLSGSDVEAFFLGAF